MIKKILVGIMLISGFGFSGEQQIKLRYTFNTSYFSNILGAKETNTGVYIFNFNDGEIIAYHNNYISVYNTIKIKHNTTFVQYDNCTSFMTDSKIFRKFYICGDYLFDVGEAGFTHYYNRNN